MLKLAARLPSDVELGLKGWGQSNAAPQGTRADGLAANPALVLKSPGQDITGAVLTGAAAGSSETFAVSSTLTAQEWVGAEFRAGTVTAPLVGYGTITANAGGAGTSTLTVTWTVAASAGTVAGYVCFRDDRHKSYSNVRVLTPYQPESVGGYPAGVPTVAGYTLPADVTSYEDLGLFLPATFLEGIASCGSAGTGTYAALVVTCTAGLTGYAGTTDDVFIGGYLYVRDPATGNSWRGDITDSTGHATTPSFTVASLVASNPAAPTPPTGAGAVTFEVHLPHYANNPYHAVPGPGFRYPNNFSVPAGPILNRAKGVTAKAYPDRFGVMLPLAWRLSSQLGRRLNVTWLGVSASSIYRNGQLFAGPDQYGWWKSSVHLDWFPDATDGIAERMRKLTLMAPRALQAEGNTKPLRDLCGVGFQGEAEAGSAIGRKLYKDLLPSFWHWLIRKIEAAGTSFYASAGKFPLMHAGIPSIPWEIDVPSLAYLGDVDGLVNAAIKTFTAKHPYGCTIDTNDSAKGPDVIHFAAAGEDRNAELAATALLTAIEQAISTEDDLNDAAVLAICNEALAEVGDTARITSLDATIDDSAQAARCAMLYAPARKELLQRQSWLFSTVRGPLEALTDTRTVEYPYAYAMPRNAVRMFATLPEGASDDYSPATQPIVSMQASGDLRALQPATSGPTPEDFSVELDVDGYEIVYSKTQNAVGRWNVLISDARLYPPLFRSALVKLLASKLASPTVKGSEGKQLSRALLQECEAILGHAKEQDAMRRQIRPTFVPSIIAARRGVRKP